MKRILLPAVLFSLLPAFSVAKAEVLFSYFDGEAGCMGRFSLDADTGRFAGPSEQLFREKSSIRLERVRLAEDGRTLVGLNEDDDNPHVIALDTAAQPPSARIIPTPDRPRYFTLHGDHALVAGHEGQIHWISLSKGAVETSADPSQEKKIPSVRPEGLLIKKDGTLAAATCMQDSPSSKALGGRVAILELPSLKLKKDLFLPREFNDLNFSKGSKDRGPLPHLLLASPETNTIAIFCRLYGAVALADLDAFWNGEWKNFKYVPTALSGKIGEGRPEIGQIFEVDGVSYLFVSNSSEEGGLVFIDLKKREVAGTSAYGARGLNYGSYLPESRKFAAVLTGVKWSRGENELVRKHDDGQDLLVFDLSVLGQNPEIPVTAFPLGAYVYNMLAVPGSEKYAFVASRRLEDRGLELRSLDIATGQVVDSISCPGVVRNFIGR